MFGAVPAGVRAVAVAQQGPRLVAALDHVAVTATLVARDGVDVLLLGIGDHLRQHVLAALRRQAGDQALHRLVARCLLQRQERMGGRDLRGTRLGARRSFVSPAIQVAICHEAQPT